MRDERPAAAPLRPARRADPHQLRGAGRRADRRPPLPQGARRGRRSTSPAASPSPPRSTPTRTPTSSRSATARAPTRWARCRSCRSRTADGSPRGLALRWRNCARHPVLSLRSLSNRRWSERTIIGLVMQSLDNSLTTYRKPKGLGKGLLTARQGHGAPNPTQIPEAAEAAAPLAEEINGFAGQQRRRADGHPADRALPRRLPDRRRRRARRDRPVPPALRPPGHLTWWTAPRSPPTSASTRR